MKAPRFWTQTRPTLLARFLQPFGALYGAVTAWRMDKPRYKVTIPVICVGNLTAGGAGKTPTVIALGAYLLAHGLKPVVLSRGYGGSLSGPLHVDPVLHDAAQIGDEPLLLAQTLPVIVSRNRVSGAELAARLGNVILMDDGLQNPALAKDIALAVIEGTTGFGNGLCIPAGPLRAAPERQWPFIDHVLVIGNGAAGQQAAAKARAAGKPVWDAVLVPDQASILHLAGCNVLALSGIGQPDKFRDTLQSMGAVVVAEKRFADHAAYTPADIEDVVRAAKAVGAIVATTQKDQVKLAPLWNTARHGALHTVAVALELTDRDSLFSAITQAVLPLINAPAS